MLFYLRNVSGVTLDIDKIAAVMQRQLNEHFCPAWEQVPCGVTTSADPDAGAIVTIYDTADQQGELGDHELMSGKANGRIFAKTILDAGGTIDQGALSVTQTLSHEILEISGDPYANWWSDYPGGDLVALESADPVEDESYDIDGMAVSNFVTSRWFRDGPGPYDWMRTRTKPFEVSAGGYKILYNGGAVFGERWTPARGGRMRMAKRAR